MEKEIQSNSTSYLLDSEKHSKMANVLLIAGCSVFSSTTFSNAIKWRWWWWSLFQLNLKCFIFYRNVCVNLLFQRFGHAPIFIIIIIIIYCCVVYSSLFCFRSFPCSKEYLVFKNCSSIHVFPVHRHVERIFSCIGRLFRMNKLLCSHSNRPQHSTLANGIFLHFLELLFPPLFSKYLC